MSKGVQDTWGGVRRGGGEDDEQRAAYVDEVLARLRKRMQAESAKAESDVATGSATQRARV